MSDEIRLREYSSAHVSLSPTQVRFLHETMRERILVVPTGEQGRYEVKSSSHVGFVMLPEGRMLIVEPKVQVDTLFALLAEVYDPAKKIFRDELQGYTTVQDLFEFVVRFFARHVEDLIARGILRGYRSVREDAYAIRGKLLLTETMRQGADLYARHICGFNEFTADIPENQILRGTALYLQPYAYRERNLAARLRRISMTLGGGYFDAHLGQLFQRVTFHRLNEPYRPALGLARLLLDHLTFSGSSGNQAYLSYLIDMNRLFEQYLSSLVRKMANRTGLRLCAQESHWLDVGRKIQIIPDMILYDQSGPSLVLDAKYKLAAHQEDIYQIIAYCHSLNLGRAALIHPASEQAPSGQVTAKGQVPLSILYLALDLAGKPEELARHAKELETSLGAWLAPK